VRHAPSDSVESLSGFNSRTVLVFDLDLSAYGEALLTDHDASGVTETLAAGVVAAWHDRGGGWLDR
jgi:hypothetical protein